MRILLVENDPDTLRWLQLSLEDLGHSVIPANGLREGQAALETETCDVLITDVRLPDGNPNRLLELARSRHEAFAISMSGAGRTADAARSRAAGYRHHLFKPFPVSELEKVLSEAA